MIKWMPFLLVFFLTACERFPSNPAGKTMAQPEIRFTLQGVEYLPIGNPVDGLVSKKMNVMTFAFETQNARAKSVEFFGSAVFEGPPENQEHNLHFRTDQLDVESCQPGIEWNVLSSVKPDTNYTLIRCKIPMNEYSPFSGNQGKIVKVKMNEAWAYDADGKKIEMEIK